MNPLLSVVVVIVSDTTDPRLDSSHLAASLEALDRQVAPPPMEVIVPYHAAMEGIEDLDGVKRRFPSVAFIPVSSLEVAGGGSREHHDALRARGLAVARGAIIGLLEDHARPDPSWCARVVERLGEGRAAVGGAIENGIDRALNWAVYFCDFHRYQNPLGEGASPFVSDANVAYRRAALEAIRPIWQDSFHETVVNQALTARGETLWLSREVVVYQHRRNLRLGAALRERVIWGRSYAATRSRLLGASRRLLYAGLCPVLPAVLVSRMAVGVLRKGRSVGAFLRALPLTVLLAAGWSWGELVGYLTGRVEDPRPAPGRVMARSGGAAE